MSKLPSFLTNHADIRSWIDTYVDIQGAYQIEADHTVYVQGNVKFKMQAYIDKLEYFAVQFKEVTGSFECGDLNKLKTLRGAPTRCTEFHCYDCYSLTDLQGAPQQVATMNCANCTGLTTFNGIAPRVKKLKASNCRKIETTEHLPAAEIVIELGNHAIKTFTADITTYCLDVRGGPPDLDTLCRCSNITALRWSGPCDWPAEFNGINHLDWTSMPRPSCDVMRRLLLQRVTVVTHQAADWVTLLQDNATQAGNLLDIAIRFEELYNAPLMTDVGINDLPSGESLSIL